MHGVDGLEGADHDLELDDHAVVVAGDDVDAVHVFAVDGGLKLELMRKTSSKHKQHQELHAETDMMRYSGQNYGKEGHASRASGAVLIGVHDKTTGVTKIVPASSIFVMQPSVKEPRVSFDPPAAAEEAITYAAQKRQLVSTLGASKARKKQDQQAAAAVNADAVFNAAHGFLHSPG